MERTNIKNFYLFVDINIEKQVNKIKIENVFKANPSICIVNTQVFDINKHKQILTRDMILSQAIIAIFSNTIAL